MINIIDFIADLTIEKIPEKAIHMAHLCLLDAIGCMVGGMNYPSVLNLAQTISRNNPGPTAIVGTSITTTRPWASFVNTHACTFFDLDDGHRKAQGHPGGVIIPLSLMLAAENNCSGKQLLTAIAAGYETAIRSALIMRKAGGPRKGSGGWGVTGGVAAAGKLLKLSKPVLKNALGMSEYYAPQAPQDRSLAFPSSMKEGMAWASYTALTAVELASAGFDAMEPFLLDADQCNDLGINYEICSVYFKMHACCRFSHPVLDGLASLILEHGILSDSIESIKVKSFAKALLLDHKAPGNSVAAMYSIPYAIGCKLVKGEVGPGEMAANSLTDQQILEVAGKVTIEEDPDITKLFPEKCLSKLILHLKDETIIESDTLSAKGDPDNPYTREEIRSKFLNLSKSLPGNQNEKLYDLIMNIENEKPSELWEMLR